MPRLLSILNLERTVVDGTHRCHEPGRPTIWSALATAHGPACSQFARQCSRNAITGLVERLVDRLRTRIAVQPAGEMLTQMKTDLLRAPMVVELALNELP